MQTIWQFRFTVRFGIAEEDEEDDALLGPLSLTTFHHYKCRHFPRLCQFSAPFCPCHSLFSHSSRHLHNTAAVSLHSVTSAHELCYHLLPSTTRTFRREKKETSSQSAVLISDICKTCDHLHCLCSSSSTELDNSLNDNCQRCCVHTLSFDKERGRQKWTISDFKAKFRKDAPSLSYLLIGQRCKMRLVQLLKLWLLYVANYQLHLTLPRWRLLLLLFRWLLLVVDLEKWKRKW